VLSHKNFWTKFYKSIFIILIIYEGEYSPNSN
jgi:hypothetical protein